jgi:hypothetical protein
MSEQNALVSAGGAQAISPEHKFTSTMDYEKIAKEEAGLRYSGQRRVDYLMSKLDTAENCRGYLRWRMKSISDKLEPELVTIPAPSQFINTIANTNFRRNDNITRVIRLLDLPAMPCIGLGTLRG